MAKRPPQLAQAVAIVALCAACQETTALGAECPSFREHCEAPDEARGDGESSSAGEYGETLDDAGSPLADAAPPGELEPPAAAVFGIQNPSFELTRGSGGEIDKLDDSEIEPWYTCRGGLLATSEADVSDGKHGSSEVVTPQDGQTLVSMSFPLGVALGGGLFQQLETPLRTGQRVAFVIDVRSVTRDDDQLALVVSGTNNACLAEAELVASRTVSEQEGWVSLCLSFVPGRDFAQIGLEARSQHVLGEGSRLMIDHIRTSPDCK